jgi:signal peptidase I
VSIDEPKNERTLEPPAQTEPSPEPPEQTAPSPEPPAQTEPTSAPPARTEPSPERPAQSEPSAEATARAKRSRSGRRLVVEYALTAVVAIVVAFVVQAYIVKPYRVPTPSMATTIQPGDRVLIDRLLYDSRDVERGDIVVFEGPAAVGNQVLLKRVVGLPGDMLELTDGVLYVNGAPADSGGVGPDGELPETRPAYGQLEEHPEWSLALPYTVPDDHYYLMGDNRSDSFDSRFWGPVPRSSIIGRAFAVYWPLREIRTLH